MALAKAARPLVVIGGLAVGCLGASAQSADPAAAWFDKAVQIDLGSDEQAAHEAFLLYRKAAQAGLPDAEFNVAVMLDSGRGVATDLTQAAVWYARAASHGNQRAAYNLGQLYEAGQGVPQNGALAQAWFVASNLPAAKARRVADSTRGPASLPLPAPVLIAPADRSSTVGASGLELVWTAKPYPEPTRFYVELRTLDPVDPKEIFTGFVNTSAVLATMPTSIGEYAWRVTSVARGTGHYATSDWARFSVEPSGIASQVTPSRDRPGEVP